VVGAAIIVTRIASGEIENSGRFAGPSRSGFAALQGLGERFVSERNVQPKDVCRGRARGTQSQPRAATRLS
jgi:hypothetical protein